MPLVLKNTPIRTKLFLAVLAVAMPALMLMAGMAYWGGKRAVTRTTFDHLTSVRASKAHQIEQYFDQIRKHAGTLARDRMIIDTMVDFDEAHQDLEGVEFEPAQADSLEAYHRNVFGPRIDPDAYLPSNEAEAYLQYHYIVANPNPVGEKALLDDAGDDSRYTEVHRSIHPILRDYVREFGFHDLFLVTGSGTIVYTVSKEVDLGASLIDGPLRDSNLGTVFEMAQRDTLSGSVALVDFAPYAPSFGEPSSFMAAPILDGVWLLGVLVLQLPVGEIDGVMTNNQNWHIEGLGETGESFLVGPDYLMRSNSRFVLEDPEGYTAAAVAAGASEFDARRIRDFGTTILVQEVRTPAVEDALAGNANTTISTDYRGVDVLASYAPLDIEGVDWAIVSEIHAREAFSQIRTFTRNLVLAMTSMLAVLLLAAWTLSRFVVAPIVGLEAAARKFTDGEMDVEVPVSSSDELGRLARAFNTMVSAIRQKTSDLKKTAEELEGVRSVILRWDDKGRISFINDYGLDLFGFEAEELIGKPLVGSIVPAAAGVDENIRQMIEEIAANPARYEIDETENQRKNGDWVWMAWRNTPILNEDGSLREILTIGIDISERRRIEREIAEQKQMLENTLESLTHPFYVIDAEDYSITIANSAARALGESGVSTCHALTHGRSTPCDSGRHTCPMVEVKKTGKPVIVEHIHKDPDGNPRFVEVNGYPIFDDDGNVVQMIEYSIDITERKELALRLEEAKETAESANRAKSTFLANMSHELRTPMNAIIGYSEMLAEDAEDEGHDEMVPDLQKINAAGKHLLALINDILDLSKIEAGRMELFLERIDLKQMLDEAAATVLPLVTKNNNRLETDFGDNLGAVRADLTKLRQSLFNLLSNAAKFTEGGTITLATRREMREGREWVFFDVRDTGIGIPTDKLDTVFEEFAQADDSTTRDYGGTGLGLPISRRFCQMMGGDITVASEIGRGTTFTIEIPTRVDAIENAPSEAVVGEPTPALPVASGTTILIVDDDPDSRDLLQRTLESEGYSVAVASTGEEGLALARELKPALMTLDVLMPSMDGWSVLQAVKADPELKHIPVMMISIAGDKEMGYTLGAVESLTKPVDRDQLRKLAHQYAQPSGGGNALVVDDDEAIRALFQRALEEDGWTVSLAENGAVALEMAQSQPPDLILLDLMMPVMDGFEFVMHFRRVEECRSIPIIVVTSKDLGPDDRKHLLGGVERIVEKGALTRKELVQQVREVMGPQTFPSRDEKSYDSQE